MIGCWHRKCNLYLELPKNASLITQKARLMMLLLSDALRQMSKNKPALEFVRAIAIGLVNHAYTCILLVD